MAEEWNTASTPVAVGLTTASALCNQLADLKNSHVAPNSFFNALEKEGKLVRFDMKPGTAVEQPG